MHIHANFQVFICRQVKVEYSCTYKAYLNGLVQYFGFRSCELWQLWRGIMLVLLIYELPSYSSSCWLPCHYESGGTKSRGEHCRSWLIRLWPSIAYKTWPWIQEWLKYYVWYLYIFLSLELDNWPSVLKDYCLRSASLISAVGITF